MFVYNILIMETPTINNKGRLVLIPNPNFENSCLANFHYTPLSFGKAEDVATCNGKDFDFLFTFNDIEPTDSEIAIDSSFRKLQEIKNAYEKTIHQEYPLTPDECFKKE